MKLVMYERDGMGRPGMIIGDFILDLQDAWPKKIGAFPKDLLYLLKEGAETMNILQDWVSQMGDKENNRMPLSSSQLLPPITQPGKLLCIGLNYEDHARETGKPIPKEPIIFGKYSNALIGNEQPIRIPDVTRKVDYEAELGVVIGRHTYRVGNSEALDYVFGYTCANDVTARDKQPKEGQWTYAKGFDTFCPLGPVIETEIGNPEALKVRGYLNDRLVQEAPTSDHYFTVADIIEYVAGCMTLLPGDVIMTGTPAGIGPLLPGDRFEVLIEGIGSLYNSVTKAE